MMTRRLGVTAVLAGLHLVLLLMLLRSSVPPPAAVIPALAVVAVPAPLIAAAPPPPAPRALPVPIEVAAPSFETEAVMPPGGCAMTDHLQSELRQDVAALAAVARIPRAARTVANVVTLWSGDWVAARPLGGAEVLAPIRAAVVAAVRAAPAACRAEAIMGPRLVFVTDATLETAIVLAFGSGRWRWDDLVE